MGPLLYTLFTNELPEVIHDHDHGQLGGQDKGDGQEEGWPAYNLGSVYKGNIFCYADDITLTTTNDKVAKLSAKLTEKYNAISDFMVDNRLKLNDEKLTS